MHISKSIPDQDFALSPNKAYEGKHTKQMFWAASSGAPGKTSLIPLSR